MTQNTNERYIRRAKNGKLYDCTESCNNRFGNPNNKRPKLLTNIPTPTQYEPNKLFNILAGGALIAVLTIGGFNTLANIVKSGIDVKNNIEDVKDTITDVKELVSNPSKNGSSYEIKNLLTFDIDEEQVKECIINVYDKFSNNDVETVVNEVIIVDYEDANTEEKYKKNILKKVANKENTVTVILISKDVLTNDSAMERYNECQDIIMNNTDLVDTTFNGVMVNGVSNIPNDMNMAIAITYYCSK